MIAAVQPSKGPTSQVMSVAKFERFFQTAAGLDVDKQDLKRYSDFINRKIDDLLVRAEAVAKANGRAVIQPFELPIVKGLQQSINEFEKIDEEIELWPILEHLAYSRRLSSLMAKVPRINCPWSWAGSAWRTRAPSRSSMAT
jgi:Domain of unknown function (DUF1931)